MEIWKKTSAKVFWNIICLPKKEGGLGFRPLSSCERYFPIETNFDAVV